MKTHVKQLEKITYKYYDEIYNYCRRRVKSENDASDLTQTVFMELNMSFYNGWIYQ